MIDPSNWQLVLVQAPCLIRCVSLLGSTMLYINTVDVYDNDDGVMDGEDGYEWRRVVMTINICSVR